jgi:UDP-N-acetylglucosamine 2-epimerase
MKVLSIVGARPQFIKAAPVWKVMRDAGLESVVVHTGQHYDYAMSQLFFDELGIPEPDVNLGVGSGSHGRQTGQVLTRIEEVLLEEKPDWVLIFGDTNSTLAGALAACKLNLPLAHVEAGLRSYNRAMPEEHNRVLSDHCSDVLFCPTQRAVENLEREGITHGVYRVGDTMYDAVLQFAAIARERSTILQSLGLERGGYYLATLHRPYNTDIPENLSSILSAFLEIDAPIIFPVHPRTRQKIAQLNGRLVSDYADQKIKMIEPVGYLDMLTLEQNARAILTDSGGMQKEAYFFGVPCITLRPETEWVETVEAGSNRVVGSSRASIVAALNEDGWTRTAAPPLFGDGRAAYHILSVLQAAAANQND